MKFPSILYVIVFENIRSIEYADGLKDMTQFIPFDKLGGIEFKVILNTNAPVVDDFKDIIVNVPILGPLKI
jgi:hypothetical protein